MKRWYFIIKSESHRIEDGRFSRGSKRDYGCAQKFRHASACNASNVRYRRSRMHCRIGICKHARYIRAYRYGTSLRIVFTDAPRGLSSTYIRLTRNRDLVYITRVLKLSLFRSSYSLCPLISSVRTLFSHSQESWKRSRVVFLSFFSRRSSPRFRGVSSTIRLPVYLPQSPSPFFDRFIRLCSDTYTARSCVHGTHTQRHRL